MSLNPTIHFQGFWLLVSGRVTEMISFIVFEQGTFPDSLVQQDNTESLKKIKRALAIIPQMILKHT